VEVKVNAVKGGVEQPLARLARPDFLRLLKSTAETPSTRGTATRAMLVARHVVEPDAGKWEVV
jgi:hypothetical protein